MNHVRQRRLQRYATVFTLVSVVLFVYCIGAVAAQDAPALEDYPEILSDMDGDGTDGEPYTVTNAVELQAVAGELGANYRLGNDIDASATDDWNGGSGFLSIGDTEGGFVGGFDGDGYAIHDLTIKLQQDTAGLFGVVGEGGVVKDVSLESIDYGEEEGVEPLEVMGQDTFSVATEGTLTPESEDDSDVSVAGEYGSLSTLELPDTGIKTVATNSGEDDVQHFSGSVVAVNNGVVSDAHVTGGVLGQSVLDGDGNTTVTVGGVTGANSGAVSDSSFVGDVVGLAEVTGNGTATVDAGGVVGVNTGDVSGSGATGDVVGVSDSGGGRNATGTVGGFVGENHGTVSESYTNGNVIGVSSLEGNATKARTQAGGFSGINTGDISRSFATSEAVISLSEADAEEGNTTSMSSGFSVDNEDDGTVTESYSITGEIISVSDNSDSPGDATALNAGFMVRNDGAVTESYSVVDSLISVANSGGGDATAFQSGFIVENDGDVSGSYYAGITDSVTGATLLDDDEITGASAETNMTAFDFGGTWMTTETYPYLLWSVESLETDVPDRLRFGETFEILAFFETVDGSNPHVTELAEYASSNTDAVTVSSILEAVGVGTSTVTAEHFGIVGEQDVTVPCTQRRSLSRGSEFLGCPSDRTADRGGTRGELDRSFERGGDTARRGRGR